MNIETERLTIFPAELKHFELAMQSRNLLAKHLRVNVPPSFPEAEDALPWFYDLIEADASLFGWICFWARHRADNSLIGSGGFKEKPDAAGRTEIGYSIIPEYRRRRFASEMVGALLNFGFSKKEVKVIEAETLTDNVASIKILKRFGMRQTGARVDESEGKMFRWELSRENYLSSMI